jgi:hypothetical protein
LSFAAIPFVCAVFDEIQKVKSPTSLLTRAAKTVNSDFTLGLTGTPIENQLADLWCIMDIINPGCLADLKSFSAKYQTDDIEALEKLRAMLLDASDVGPAPVLRRMKADHLDGLPEKKIHIRKRKMPDAQAKIYAEIVARAKQPDSGPMLETLHLFRNRTYAASMVSTFFAAFAFFGAIIFLPRWFQIVQSFTPTTSGLALLPLMVGLIFSSIASGLIVARTGKYKWLTVGAIVLMGISTALMTQLRADTPVPIVWFWMFLSGLGVGPTFAVFTLIVQNAVPFNMLGVATSNLTFFRQIGGTVALAIVGTLFASSFQSEIGPQMTAAGVPDAIVNGFTAAMHSGQVDFNQLTGTGDLGQSIVAAQPALAPVVDKIVAGIHQAFSLGVASTFIIGVGASILAALAAAAMQELALRRSTTAQAAAAAANEARRPAVPAAD